MALTILLPVINSISVSPEIVAVGDQFKVKVSVSDIATTVYEVAPYSGEVYSGQSEVVMWQ